jgi:hypothetical protein
MPQRSGEKNLADLLWFPGPATRGALWARPARSPVSDADGASAGQLRDRPREEFLVEGKGSDRPSSTLQLRVALASSAQRD